MSSDDLSFRTWEYRVILHQRNGKNWYGVYEVFYDQDGQPDSYGDCLDAESFAELTEDLELMLQAVTKPVLHAHLFHKQATT